MLHALHAFIFYVPSSYFYVSPFFKGVVRAFTISSVSIFDVPYFSTTFFV